MKTHGKQHPPSRMQVRFRSAKGGLIVAACGALAWSAPAHAYIDGGTASMIFQLTIAGALGALVTIKSFWFQIKAFFTSFGKGLEDVSGDE